MDKPDTQVVETTGEVPRDVLLGALSGRSPATRPAAPAAEAPATPEPVTETKPTEPEAKPAAAAAQETTQPPAAVADPAAAVLDGLLGEQPKPAVWTDEAKAAFKAMYGHEDPVAFKAELDSKIQAAELLKTQYDQVAPLVERLNGAPPQVQKMIDLVLAGKHAEAKAYIASTPEAVLGNKSSKDLSDKDLINAYFPGKIKPEQWDLLDDPDSDQDLVDALKTRIGLLRETAAEKHDAGLTAAASEREAERKAQAEYGERMQKSIADTIAKAKSSHLGGYVDQGTIDAVSNGSFISEYVNADGTMTENSTTHYLWAKHGPELVKAADKRGYERGRHEAMQEATSRQPAQIASQGRTPGDAPRNPTEADHVRNILFNATKS